MTVLSRRFLCGAVLAAPTLIVGRSVRAATEVDVELILAVDVSRSVDAEEMEMQMRGYAAAFRDPRLAQGIASGPLGAIAVTLFVWSDSSIQHTLVPWMLLDGRASCERFASAVDGASRATYMYTSISGAIDYAANQFGQHYEGTRRVVDISGDGPNNTGQLPRPLAVARADALEKGIVINGLVVLDRVPQPVRLTAGQPPVDEHYRDEVIGGPGAFLMVAEGFESFGEAVRRKIIREIVSRPTPGPLVERVFA